MTDHEKIEAARAVISSYNNMLCLNNLISVLAMQSVMGVNIEKVAMALGGSMARTKKELLATVDSDPEVHAYFTELCDNVHEQINSILMMCLTGDSDDGV